MINAVTGIPGEGKTCFSVQHIILKELMVGKRPIFSNVAWNNKEVIKFCKSYGYKVDPKRLNFLEEEQIQNFWTHCPRNCLIVLDEVGEYFNSQSWKEIGLEAGSYARQHRKLGHETYLIVQDLGHIYKQFRDMIYEEIRIVNLSNRRLGPFKLPKFFIAKWILKDTKEVHRSRMYRFNTEVFKVYETMATCGGLLDTAEEIEVKETESKLTFKEIKRRFAKFLGDRWLLILCVSIICACLYIPKYFFNTFISSNEEVEEAKTIPLTKLEKVEKNEETDNRITNMLSGATFGNGAERQIQPYYGSRYDSNTKRNLRAESSLR